MIYGNIFKIILFFKNLIDEIYQQPVTNEIFHLFYILSFLNSPRISHSQVAINFLENIHWCFKKFQSIFS